jgi:hypothetical protein
MTRFILFGDLIYLNLEFVSYFEFRASDFLWIKFVSDHCNDGTGLV